MSSEKPVKLSAKLPKTAALNGIDTIHGQLAGYGSGYVIMSVSAYEVSTTVEGVHKPVAVITHVEGLPEGPLAVAAERLMRDARKARESDSGVLPGMGRDDLADTPGGN